MNQGFYKCDLCGNVVHKMNDAKGNLACCGKDMRLLKANTMDASNEKHVPVIEVSGDTVTVTVGSVEHPMVEEHWIQWVALIAGEKVYINYLTPGQAPKAVFPKIADSFEAYEYCNLHGLWYGA